MSLGSPPPPPTPLSCHDRVSLTEPAEPLLSSPTRNMLTSHLLLSWAKAGNGLGDDWDVYYERGRKTKESIIKNEAARSEGDYQRKVLLARTMRDRADDWDVHYERGRKGE
jgi:hypothetical protein